MSDPSDEEVIDVSLDDIDLFINQSRERFDETELNQLAENIKANGQLQPGVAWLDTERRRYILICGERRYRALKLAGRRAMTVKVLHGTLTQSQMLQINLSENIQRASLNAVERGKAFRRLMQFEDITAREVAGRMHVSDATVSRDLSLLDLPEFLQNQVIAGSLPASVASHIARIGDDETRRALADQFASGQQTREGIVTEVNHLLNSNRKPRAKKASRLACRLPDNGVSLTLSADTPLTWEIVTSVIARLTRSAEQLRKGGKDISELAKSLRAS